MKNKELYAFKRGIDAILDIEACVKFNHALSRNYRKLVPLIKELDDSIKPSPEWEEIMSQQKAVNESLCEKDDKGNPTPNDLGQFVFSPENEKARMVSLNEIKEKNDGAFNRRKKVMDQYRDFLEEDSDFKPYMVDQEFIPDMKTRFGINIDYMVKDDE